MRFATLTYGVSSCGEVDTLIFQRILHKVECSGDSQVLLWILSSQLNNQQIFVEIINYLKKQGPIVQSEYFKILTIVYNKTTSSTLSCNEICQWFGLASV
jgi:hypothetical protein